MPRTCHNTPKRKRSPSELNNCICVTADASLRFLALSRLPRTFQVKFQLKVTCVVTRRLTLAWVQHYWFPCGMSPGRKVGFLRMAASQAST
jgi:hypothetical protein